MAESLLEDVNRNFHDVYDRIRREATLDGPVCVLMADSLLFYRGQERTEVNFTPPAFHAIKSIAHAPIAIFAALRSNGHGAAQGVVCLSELQSGLLAFLGAKASESDPEPAYLPELRAVARDSVAYLRRLASDPAGARAGLDDFAREMGPRLLRLTEHATRIQLRALDAHVTRLFGSLGASERAKLQVVVTGDHQARARSLAAQYFRKRLHEPEHAEERVTYAEGIVEERQALALVGTRRVDRAMASAFFGDPRRLQRDILGDAAKQLLDSCDWPMDR